MMVIEFAGEVVGQDVANAREAVWAQGAAVRRRYNRRNVGGCYFFRMDAEHIVDATVKGNESRFINHCCDPNCDARVVNINNENKIIFFANRDINPGEEITYDYKFQYEIRGQGTGLSVRSQKLCRKNELIPFVILINRVFVAEFRIMVTLISFL